MVEREGSSLESHSWRSCHPDLITSKRPHLQTPSPSRLRCQHQHLDLRWKLCRRCRLTEESSVMLKTVYLFPNISTEDSQKPICRDPGMTFGLGVCSGCLMLMCLNGLCLPRWLFCSICSWTEPGPHQAHGTYVGACGSLLCQRVWLR